MPQKKNVAKLIGWLGAALTTLAATNSFGKYSALAASGGALLTGWGITNASETSFGHPDGKNS